MFGKASEGDQEGTPRILDRITPLAVNQFQTRTLSIGKNGF